MDHQHRVYLILGGNLGDTASHFERARGLIRERLGLIVQISDIYETDPWGMETEDLFYNQVLCVLSNHHPMKMMRILHDIERDMGRRRSADVIESREIDIDILFIDEMILSEPGLEVPHPRMHLRRFALQPLSDIAPDLVHPIFGINISTLLNKCEDPLHVTRIAVEGQHD